MICTLAQLEGETDEHGKVIAPTVVFVHAP